MHIEMKKILTNFQSLFIISPTINLMFITLQSESEMINLLYNKSTIQVYTVM